LSEDQAMSGFSSRWKRFGEQLRDIVASWGGDELAQPSERPQPGRQIRVYITSDGERVHVGSLSKEHGEYVFEYSQQFKEHKELAPISAFREVSQPHRTKELPAFFRVRVPPLEREDVKRTVLELGIAPDDEFALLGAVGRKTITSPYELELREPEVRARPSQPALVAHT
jgi:HipA-like protein